MNIPKGKLFALIAVFAAIGLVTATGAFTTVTAERTADVSVAGDSAALLGLSSPGTANAQEYLQRTGDGNTLAINLAGENGAEVNLEATTAIKDVFTITNQGSQPVAVTFVKADNLDDEDNQNTESQAVALGIDQNQLVGSYQDQIAYADGADVRLDTDGDSPDWSNGITLDPGESINVGIFIDTEDADHTTGITSGDGEVAVGDLGTGTSGEDLIDELIVYADADETGNGYDYDGS